MPDRSDRQQELERRMADLSVDLVFLPPSADLEYLTGFKRRSSPSATSSMPTAG